MALMIFGAVQHATALGTAFTYQGRLDDTGQCADGYYAFQFSLWDQQAPGGTKLFDNTTDTSEVLVTNGLFTVTLDFGPAAFTGNTYYLDTMVHTNTFPTFTDLSPRLLIMPTPYAIYAETSGGVAPGSITGTDIASSTITTGNIASGQVVKSLNGLEDVVTLSSSTPDLTISSVGGTITLRDTATSADTASTLVKRDSNGSFNALNIGADRSLIIDQLGQNSGGFGGGAAGSSASLSFGLPTSGEGISSQRTGTGNVDDLVLWTDFHPRQTILQNGNVGISETNPAAALHITGPINPPPSALSSADNGLLLGTTGTSTYKWIQSYGGPLILNPINNSGDNIGIGTASPQQALSVVGGLNLDQSQLNSGTVANALTFGSQSGEGIGSQRTSGANQYDLVFYTESTPRMTILNGGDIGIGTPAPQQALSVVGGLNIDQSQLNSGTVANALTFGTQSGEGIGSQRTSGTNQYDLAFYTGFSPRMTILNNGNVGIGTISPVSALQVNGTVTANVLTITGGSDLAEPFEMSQAEIPKGSVVIIDENRPGQLKMSDQAYDHHVAGIVSGANGINPGISLHQDGAMDGHQNVALSGRVYVQADAANGPIQPGDLLTTSTTPGHAMRVTDHAKAQGAVIGKAMTGLKEGQGTVLVLVSLE